MRFLSGEMNPFKNSSIFIDGVRTCGFFSTSRTYAYSISKLIPFLSISTRLDQSLTVPSWKKHCLGWNRNTLSHPPISCVVWKGKTIFLFFLWSLLRRSFLLSSTASLLFFAPSRVEIWVYVASSPLITTCIMHWTAEKRQLLLHACFLYKNRHLITE